MRYLIVALSILFSLASPARAEVSVGIAIPGVNIGINMPAYPQLVPVPGCPVYYDPRAPSNYFFYDGLFWVYVGNNWYTSSWYNGPWWLEPPENVPLSLLRVPVRYYRRPPEYFRDWDRDDPPHWGEHWGHAWEERHPEWKRWDRHAAPAAAPLPDYQRTYSGKHYPRTEEQRYSIRHDHYNKYQPRESVTQRHFAPPHGQGRENRAAMERGRPHNEKEKRGEWDDH